MNEKKVVILPLEKIDGHEVGGKAKGLAKLKKIGLNVPEGFVIVAPNNGNTLDFDSKIFSYYHEKFGDDKTVAVRSSAIDEDGYYHSNAGQYTSFLNVKGEQELEMSIKKCFESVNLERVQEYKKNLSQSDEKRMAVIVQEMVDAKVAGVLFTRDPQTGEKKIIINAVEGLGNKLVDGTTQGEQYVTNFEGQIIETNIENHGLLNEKQLKKLVHEALNAEEHFGCPLDMEWAIDKMGHIVWLQARPITTISTVSINELDTPAFSNHVYTKANVGEMLPGAVTPLSLSVFAEAIDIGLVWMYRKIGAISKNEKPRFICNFYNHLFFDLSNMYRVVSAVLGASKESFELNIFGRIVPETAEYIPKNKALIIRLFNGIKYYLFVNGHKKALKKLKRMKKSFGIQSQKTIETIYDAIDSKLYDLFYAYYLHYQVSANSGAMNSALTAFIGNGEFSEEALSKAALLLSDINGIESANILQSLEEIANEIINNTELLEDFLSFSTEKAILGWFQSPRSKTAGTLFDEFLARHGHRCIREAELREKDWQTDPIQPLRTIVSLVKTRQAKIPPKSPDLEKVCDELKLKGIKKRLFLWIYEKAKDGMRNRELSKSLVIKIQSHFRKAYVKLGEKMHEANILPDPDLIYFLKHDELGELIKNNKKELITKAQIRKKLLAQQKILQFPEIAFGKPEPIPEVDVTEAKGLLKGVPVSRGKVKGRVRIVRSIEDAEQLEPEEIMVASFTDIGWSPYYSRISGLITEIGGSLSHGAIVAREYGLPLVSGIANATKILKNGQLVLLDGDKGTITILSD